MDPKFFHTRLGTGSRMESGVAFYIHRRAYVVPPKPKKIPRTYQYVSPCDGAVFRYPILDSLSRTFLADTVSRHDCRGRILRKKLLPFVVVLIVAVNGISSFRILFPTPQGMVNQFVYDWQHGFFSGYV